MTAVARFRQIDIQRALNAARRAGYEEVRVRIDAAGQIEIIAGKGASESAGNDFEKWLHKDAHRDPAAHRR